MSQDLDLSFLKGLEREVILDVLYRDQMLRKVDEERIRYAIIILECDVPVFPTPFLPSLICYLLKYFSVFLAAPF